jgi:membrane-associated phospholipid phosphatase
LRSTSWRNWLVAGLVVAIITRLCIAYVDEPVMQYFRSHFENTPGRAYLNGVLAPFNLFVIFAVLFLIGSSFWKRLPESAITPFLLSVAIIGSVIVDLSLKILSGRLGPHHHDLSFPSGTAMISTAFTTVMFGRKAPARVFAALVSAFLCVAVVVGNWHWVSDVVAGVYVGALLGWLLYSSARNRSGKSVNIPSTP